ncbi:MAG: hypothetical protein ABSG03_37810 [Bryobacteraceae bacterium]
MGIFLPTFTIHQMLQAAKDERENRLSELKAHLLRSFEFTVEGTPKSFWKILGRIVSIEAVAFLIGNRGTVMKVAAKLTH